MTPSEHLAIITNDLLQSLLRLQALEVAMVQEKERYHKLDGARLILEAVIKDKE